MSVTDYRVELQRAPENAHRRWTERRGCLLTIEQNGEFGQGEAAPLPGYSPESLDDAREALQAVDWSRYDDLAELGRDDLAELLRAETLAASPAARFAVETAVLDLSARRRGMPLHQRLSQLFGREIAPAQVSAEIPLAALIDNLEPDVALRDAEQALSAGFMALKVKVGRAGRFSEEIALLTLLRRSFGPDFALRLDANGAFDVEQAPARLHALAAFAPELIEEPLAPGSERLLSPEIPVALDESLVDGFDLDRDGARARGLAALVLKPALLGGIGACWALADRARAAGLALIVSHLFDGPVGYAASVELCLALGSQPYAQGLAPHAALTAWPARLRAPGLSGVRLARHRHPGLGLPHLEALPA